MESKLKKIISVKKEEEKEEEEEEGVKTCSQVWHLQLKKLIQFLFKILQEVQIHKKPCNYSNVMQYHLVSHFHHTSH